MGAVNKPLISITRINLKGVESELRRIADAMEAYLSHVHGYNMRAPKPLPSDPAADEASVGYSDDATSAKLEIIDDLVAHGIIAKPNAGAEEEDE